MVLPSVHMSPGGGGARRGDGGGDGGGARRGDGGGDGVGSWRDRDLAAGQQWNRNSRHRMVDRWVDQVIKWREKNTSKDINLYCWL